MRGQSDRESSPAGSRGPRERREWTRVQRQKWIVIRIVDQNMSPHSSQSCEFATKTLSIRETHACPAGRRRSIHQFGERSDHNAVAIGPEFRQ